MKKTHIVIPIGVGAPGTPVLKYLENSISSILKQTTDDYILTIAADSNIPDSCKNFLEINNIKIKWFDTYSFFRTGGIWKKIFDTWKEEDTKYVAFLHYDDFWHKDKLKNQVELMERKNLNGSFSEVYIMDENENIVSGDLSHPFLNKNTICARSCAFAHSCIINKQKLFDSGILKLEEKWSENYYDSFNIGFEDIWSVYIHKIKNIEKVKEAKFFWRTHDRSVSNTFTKNNLFIKEQKKITMLETKEIDDNWLNEYNIIIKETIDEYE